MKPLLRKLFAPILNIFESGEGPYEYKASSRKILVFMSCLFIGLATLVFFLAKGDLSYMFPVLIFGSLGLICLLIGLLGNERAVAKIWGSR